MRILTLFLTLAVVSLVACTRTDSGSAGVAGRDVEAWDGELPISEPWLRQQLPDSALAYARIPHPVGMLAIPKGNVLGPALGSRGNIENLMAIQQGIGGNLATALPQLMLLDTLRSPIEVAAVGAPLPSALIAATLRFRSNAEFEAFIAELGQTALPGLALAGPLDDSGFGQLVVPGAQVQLNFDQATGRVAFFAGLLADPATFATLLGQESGAHPMHALEAQIDESGQGLFAWIDTAQAVGVAAMMDPGMAQALSAPGLNQIRALAAGTGIANGKGRLKLVADAGTDVANRFVPVVSNAIAATSVGTPRNLLLLSIPTVEEFARIESIVLAMMGPEAGQEWFAAKAAFAEVAGTSIEDILGAIGPDFVTVADRAGDYLALHVRDSALLDSVLTRLSGAAEVTIAEREVAGETIRYVELPGTLGVPEEALANEDVPPFLPLIMRMRNRMYWIEEGEYLYIASAPQMLIDRINMGADSSIASWLEDTQRIDLSSSLLAATGSTRNLPRMMYNGYLGVMQALADIVEVEYDIWAMPTANQLGLPDQGAVGLAVNLGEPYLSLEISFESHPAELLFGGGGMAAVAATGIMAAIAIPAYQDYTIRAQVSEGLNIAAAVRAAAAETWLSTGVVPADREATGLTPSAADTSGAYTQSVDIADGRVIVAFGNAAHPQIAGRTVTLTPYLNANGGVVWVCGYSQPAAGLEPMGEVSEGGTTVMPQYLPSACRN